jgi:hypothetical protein
MWHYLIASFRSEEKMEYNETVRQLFVDFRKAYDSVKREVLYNIEFGMPMKLVGLIKMCLNEWSKTRRYFIARELVGKPEGMGPIGRPRRRWVDNIKLDLKDTGRDDVDWKMLGSS